MSDTIASDNVAQVRPWIRFWARSFDGNLVFSVYALALAFAIPNEWFAYMQENWWADSLPGILLLLLWR